jgi:transmembrane sensor
LKNQTQLIALYNKYLANECSLEEVTALMQYFNSEQPNVLEEHILREFEGLELQKENYPALPTNVFEGIKARMAEIKPNPVRIRLWPRIAVAASILIVASLGFYFYSINQSANDQNQVTFQNDIAPGKNGATLTLANGKKIFINDALVGNIAEQAGVKISKTSDGQIIYVISSERSDEKSQGTGYNTLSTTRGEQTQVRLPDGSLVFLNAMSSLKYPTSFAKQAKRQVSLTGEGYFEIAKDKAHPFIVTTDKQEVAVLGTHFNINSYADEASVRTTLLEGSVRVVTSSRASEATRDLILKPNQQSTLLAGNFKITNVNAEDAVAWKNGTFIFNDETLESIMNRVSRWYDVDVVYQGNINKRELYYGGVSRYDNISKVLQTLELTKGVHFKIEGRRLLVMK